MRYIKKLIAALGLCFSSTGFAATEGNTYKLYFLGGQSNMEGFGYTNELPKGEFKINDRVKIFSGQPALDNQTHGGVGLWQTLEPGFGTGFKTDGKKNILSGRFGPELFFGQVMASTYPQERIAIIKYAAGGTGLAQGVGYGNWHPDFNEGAGLNQYDHALKTIRNAFANRDIDGDGAPDTLIPSGIVWMQGEADAYDSQAAADAYRANLQRLMDLLRATLRVDDLPVVIGKITDSGMSEDGSVMDYIKTVQDAQQDYVKSDTCAAYMTATKDFGYLDDGWHYNTEGVIRMGAEFAKTMSKLEAKCGK
ncbi:sialate O-acetylesterase [Microbulbifer thermotolerans]|uniref:Sialate O-acetylesterase n=1 Tax=Microbulbifer thermotolerans TaxID=252514 RepID=A0A143HP59_MICTH|nr:sialate O-acetylesterase [Microbulbifer thermotolerans]AMX03478.1 hypothetical protein A3224_13640 [Microbulbifer thermotolerans]MCX2780627.1 sialate O-acetylesterase [Microbulbifer thermotolerans]MCX2795374.1 sialate O-acetylesterase [Microbulbifer thermotolerans]MCX2802446.1 sialate O-acetylesterase [Microbulbifer thermotolerans]MCX2806168.1 sialate O-acetylesterase [Microbulbifer thermotolerans]